MRAVSIGLALFAGLLTAVPAGGQGRRLSGALASPLGDVLLFRVDAAGEQAVYLADQDVDNVFELYSAPADFSGPPRKLNGALVAGGDVVDFELSPNGTTVVYRADQDADESVELFAVPIDGSAPPWKLSAAQAVDRDVTLMRIGPGSGRVAYVSNQRLPATFEPWCVRVDGSAPAVLVHTLPAGADVLELEIAPGGSRVVHRVDAGGIPELFSAPADGSGPAVKLNGTLPQFGVVASFLVARDGLDVVYLADQGRAGTFE